ncbi:methylmalonyl-CoA mutase family protein [Emticicia sp. BO119]|uniref:methylmalonyl-CoA mutase family protein n=1 Tax=Emticicia sp. BO119 TaxID=2757768 RepID=UPI0015F09F4A|nr:methylmalonyl-CoA mutase family protein [Emticicia sp. BO119]MBA4849250.1 methylmalonyl-CoA mutase [Emticicia sp. BO119]
MTKKFFEEFPESTKKIWRAQVVKDLKGKNFEETLIWNTPEEIMVQPYYTEEDLFNLPLREIQQSQSNKKAANWQNRALAKFSQEKPTNTLVLDLFRNGADEVVIDFRGTDINKIDFAKLLDKIKLSDTPVYFQTNQIEGLLAVLGKYIHYQPKGGFIFDSLGDFFTGKAKIDNTTWESTKKIFDYCTSYPAFTAITIRSDVFHNAGANAVQELAFTLASATTYLDKLTDIGLSIGQIVPKIEFSLAIGTNYFMEIAKIRSLRFLWCKISETYQCTDNNCQINCQTSYFYDSILDAHTNMLRATTEAMSAVIGGCDSLTIHRYNAVLGTGYDEMSERIARNISVLLSDESYLGKSRDISAGSYYIENLTNDLSAKVWELFLSIEQQGGILKAFEEDFIQTEIEKAYRQKAEALKNSKIMVGVNKFISPKDPPIHASEQSTKVKHFLPNRRIASLFE